ncbi:hypothetical protein B0H17DRAFT_1187356 [Mycena rosella]|uniref:Uncharacterized protein n=1 Tax=Mycena rosella TaxID=1033263 RepID=A0AAD7FQH5_MYCRO|nr:hypothetical protein B0H17DRAFT_1187356 [Mycena rosella]
MSVVLWDFSGTSTALATGILGLGLEFCPKLCLWPIFAPAASLPLQSLPLWFDADTIARTITPASAPSDARGCLGFWHLECVDRFNCRSEAKACLVEYYSAKSKRRGMMLRIELSVHAHIPLGKLATVGGDLLDFQVHFPDSELSKVEPRVGPWRAYGSPVGTDITALDTQWKRIVVPAGSEKDLNFVSYSSIPDIWYIRKSWISQAPRLLESGIATGVKLDDLCLIGTVYLSIRIHYPVQSTDPSSNMPYLFVSSPAARFEKDGRIWIEISPPDQQYYWSFDPSGEDQLGEDLPGQLFLPEVTLTVNVYGDSWTTAQYNLLRTFHEPKGVN